MIDATRIKRLIARWTHILCGIPVLGYIYTPPEQTHYFAFSIRFVFVPVMLLMGLWMWKGHLLRRLIPTLPARHAAAGA
jgi:hypothetical protein